jgi:hypothetical protein
VGKWTIDVPDIRLDLCTSFYKLPKAETKDGKILFDAMVFVQTAFVLENPDWQDNGPAQIEAAVEGVLRVYGLLLKANPQDREPFLDELIKQREAGTLAQFVKQHTASTCNNRCSAHHRMNEKSPFANRHSMQQGKIVDHFSTLRSFFS